MGFPGYKNMILSIFRKGSLCILLHCCIIENWYSKSCMPLLLTVQKYEYEKPDQAKSVKQNRITPLI